MREVQDKKFHSSLHKCSNIYSSYCYIIGLLYSAVIILAVGSKEEILIIDVLMKIELALGVEIFSGWSLYEKSYQGGLIFPFFCWGCGRSGDGWVSEGEGWEGGTD